MSTNGTAGTAAGDGPVRMVVLGDSTCFIDADGPQLPGHPGVWPTMLTGHLERELGRPVDTHVVARAGMTVLDAWELTSKDQHVMFRVLMGADAVVVSVGSFDHAPFGIPAPLKAAVPHLANDGVRRRARKALHAAYPVVVRATGARLTRTPAGRFDRLYDQLLTQVRGLANGAAMAALGPTSHRSPYYGHRHPRHEPRSREQGRIAERHGLPYIPTWPLVEPFADALNDDGIHWPRPAHEQVADALVGPLVAQLRGTDPRPGPPSVQSA